MSYDFIKLLKEGKTHIKQGFTFKGLLPEGSNKEHYCIIVNIKVTKKSTILYFFITSQIDKAEKRFRYDPKALIHINSKDYSPIVKPSVIQCDKSHLEEIEYKTLIDNLESGAFSREKYINSSLLNKIIKAVNEGKTFTYCDKKDFPANIDLD